jgi:hypothetical protein
MEFQCPYLEDNRRDVILISIQRLVELELFSPQRKEPLGIWGVDERELDLSPRVTDDGKVPGVRGLIQFWRIKVMPTIKVTITIYD